MSYTWQVNLDIGHSFIDQQHQYLLETIERYCLSCRDYSDSFEVIQKVNYLEKLLCDHFTFEENMQQELNYPDYERHKCLHRCYCNFLAELKHKIEMNGPGSVAVRRANALTFSWLFNHVKNDDILMAQYLVQNKKLA